METSSNDNVFITTAAARYLMAANKLAEYQILLAVQHKSMYTLRIDFIEAALSLGADDIPPILQRLQDGTRKAADVTTQLSDFDSFIDELLFCRAVDTYLLYLSDLLALIFRTKPDALKSAEKLSIESILEHSSFEELIESIAERKVMDLSLMGLYKLQDHLKRWLSFPLFESEEDILAAITVVEKRNLFIHNRGLVNRRFLSRVKATSYSLGDQIIVGEPELRNGTDLLTRMVFLTDARAEKRFALPTPEDGTKLFRAAHDAINRLML